ncbi:hypothetical protein [Candidatus Parabeggiatoa sp. HSG14]|uniref:hypothetical protein n=1 Tax=Candidatus Parabeggiatoa sp. HSG14 TaxID=3055593 RepID=UPI0025A7B078|nr:hypothetical protein [Thiotrichales bacterium HSG14]
MAKIKLKPFDVTGLNIVSNSFKLRRDIHLFINYIREHTIKRSYKGNNLSKSDATRLAKLMSNPNALEELKERDYRITWLDYIDSLVLQLGFVNYNTKGVYVGYSSRSPSYQDNYMHVKEKAYNKFLDSSLQEQENYLLSKLIAEYSYSDNEFFQRTPLTLLDSFERRGCAVGILPTLNFADARQFLFNLLKDCQSDVWYSTASLVQYLKRRHPFFLIPKKPSTKDLLNEGRYGNFYENIDKEWGNRHFVPETDKDAFERVEGRYVERFLEGIPLFLGYVDVAYGEKACTKTGRELFPALAQLKAFRLKSHALRVFHEKVIEPKVTVQPNFEVHIESDFYPAETMNALTPLAKVVSEDTAVILKLEQKKVSAELVVNENLDVIELLKQLSHKALPQNVVAELEEWVGHSEMFTLYKGFGLFEGDAKLPVISELTEEKIAPNLRIIKEPDHLFEQLEKAELVPLKIEHKRKILCTLPKTAKTVFPKESTIKKAKASTKRKQVTLTKQVIVTIYVPDKDLLETFRKDLLEVRCPLEVDSIKQTITLPQTYEKYIKDTIKRINKMYQIQLKEVE